MLGETMVSRKSPTPLQSPPPNSWVRSGDLEQTVQSGALTANTEYGIDPKHRIQTGLSGALTVNTEYGQETLNRPYGPTTNTDREHRIRH